VTAAQSAVLNALARKPMGVVSLAAAVDGRVNHVQHTCDALFRRSLVCHTNHGRYMLTERGKKKAAL
jgi:predicted transcriptional regulator